VSECYGDMLSAFPELIKTYEVFKMAPHINGGYGERTDKRKVEGYWSNRKANKQGMMGIEGDLRVPDHQATFWVCSTFQGKEVVVEQNDWVEVRGKMFRVVGDSDFSHEGGFYKLLMKRVQGPTDMQVSNMKVDQAVRGDY